MADLETLGRRAGCSILSIGAVKFDENGLGEEFYRVIRRSSCTAAGLHEDPETLEWWSKQSDAARSVFEEAASEDAVELVSALVSFNNFVGKGGLVWGNGADFDNAILQAAYAVTGVQQVWEFWDNRCYRTLKSLYRDVKLVRQGVHHNALADAKTQAEHAVRIFNEKGLK
jgi:hypothetical protein